MKSTDKFKMKISSYIYLFEGDSVVVNNLVLLLDKEKHVKVFEYVSVILSGSHNSSRLYVLL